MSLLEARKTYKPFEYPWAFEFWKRQQQVHWLPEEVPLGEDCRDWAQKISEHERNLLTQIFRFFTQADVEVQNCYHEQYGRVFKPTEVKMMLDAFSNMETVHIAAYSHLLDTIGMPESEYGMFLQYKEMKDKHDYLSTFGVDNDEDIARTLARLLKTAYGEVRVTLTALEDINHFLADPEEIKEAGEEGVIILDARGPQQVVVDDGKVTGLKTWRVKAIFDEQGRFAPSYDEADEQFHQGSMIVEAIGQMTDAALLGDELTERLTWNRGRIQIDAAGRTSEAWLWAVGDMVHGPDVVTAVADGHRVAASIHANLIVTEQSK